MELFSRNKNNNKLLIRQILDLLLKEILTNCIVQNINNKGCF